MAHNNGEVSIGVSIEKGCVELIRQEYDRLRDVFNKEGKETILSIARVLKGVPSIDRSTLMAAAYVLLCANDDSVDATSIDSFCGSVGCDENRKAFLDSYHHRS